MQKGVFQAEDKNCEPADATCTDATECQWSIFCAQSWTEQRFGTLPVTQAAGVCGTGPPCGPFVCAMGIEVDPPGRHYDLPHGSLSYWLAWELCYRHRYTRSNPGCGDGL